MPGLADPEAVKKLRPLLDSPALKFQNVTVYEHSSPDESKTLPVHNPATGKVITTVRVGDSQTTKDAVTKSYKAFQTWRHRPPAERGQTLLKCADILLAHVDELATLLCLENGKPYIDARFGDVMAVQASFRYFGSLVDKLPTQFYDRGNMIAQVVREPHGVCVGILPFNWPPIHTGGKSAPALAMGNSMYDFATRRAVVLWTNCHLQDIEARRTSATHCYAYRRIASAGASTQSASCNPRQRA